MTIDAGPRPGGGDTQPSLSAVAAWKQKPAMPRDPDLASPGVPTGPSGLGSAAVRAFWAATDAAVASQRNARPDAPGESSSGQAAGTDSSSSIRVPPLYGPDALRDDPALGDAVDDRLVAWWGGEIGARSGELEKLRACGFGRLIMLAHPDCDDVDRLTAAAKCAVAEWAVDDLYLDGDSAESAPERIPLRLAMAYAAMAPARVPPPPYALQYDEQAQEDPVLRAIRSSWTNLARYASPTQVFGCATNWPSCSWPTTRRPSGTCPGGCRRCGSS